MAGLDPAIQAVPLKLEETPPQRLSSSNFAAWMAGSSPAMTSEERIA
jgi:hypothetical protein